MNYLKFLILIFKTNWLVIDKRINSSARAAFKEEYKSSIPFYVACNAAFVSWMHKLIF